MSSRSIVAGALFWTFASVACVSGVSDQLAPRPDEVCDETYATRDGWCGGDLEGRWMFRSACNRNVLSWLAQTCPAGSFEMHPGIVSGMMTMTSTGVDSWLVHDTERPVTVDIHQACIEVLGTCPRSHDHNPLVCDGDFKTQCHCRIEPAAFGETDRGPLVIDGARVSHEFDPSFEGLFCATDQYLYFVLPRPSSIRNDYWYVLERLP